MQFILSLFIVGFLSCSFCYLFIMAVLNDFIVSCLWLVINQCCSYNSGKLRWYLSNHIIAPVSVKKPRSICVSNAHECTNLMKPRNTIMYVLWDIVSLTVSMSIVVTSVRPPPPLAFTLLGVWRPTAVVIAVIVPICVVVVGIISENIDSTKYKIKVIIHYLETIDNIGLI